MVAAPSCYTGMCACRRLLSLKPTGLESGICLCTSEKAVQRNRLLQAKLIFWKNLLSACRGMEIRGFLKTRELRREMFNAVNSQGFLCILYVCSKSMNAGVIFISNTHLQSIEFLWIISRFLGKSDKECGCISTPRPDAVKASGSVVDSVLIWFTQLLMVGF